MEPESFKLNASELLFDNSNISEDPNNTAPQIDTDKLATQSKQQPDEVLKEHNRFERLCTLNNGCENSYVLKEEVNQQIDRLEHINLPLKNEDSLAVSAGEVEPSQELSLIDEQASYDRLVSNYTLTKLPYELFVPLLTFEEYCKIREVWEAPSFRSEELAVNHPSMQERLTYRSLQTLSRTHWVNDEVVNAYIRMLNTKLEKTSVRIVNSFYVSQICQKDSKGVQRIFTKNNFTHETKLIVPINRNNQHWCFLKVEAGAVLVYDSMQGAACPVPYAFRDYLRDYHGVREQFKRVTDFPQQSNGNDCGVFMLLGIKNQALGYPTWAFQQWDIRYCRMMIASELMRCDLTRRNVHEHPQL